MVDQPENASQTGRTVLVTGTSSGIGLATAVALAKAGWDTVATMRNLDRSAALLDAAEAAGVELDLRSLDVTDEGSIHRALDDTIAAHGSLSALVNNAGAASVGTVELTGIEEYRAAMEVNYFGVVQLTKAGMPWLRASGGRVVTVSSVGGVVGQPFNEAYCAAKFAVEGFMESLYPVAKTVGVRVSIIEPGAVASEFVANAGLDPQTMLAAAGVYRPALSAYLERTLKQFDSSAAQSPADVARTIVDCLSAAEAPFRSQSSDWARNFVGAKLADLDGARVTGMTEAWVSNSSTGTPAPLIEDGE